MSSSELLYVVSAASQARAERISVNECMYFLCTILIFEILFVFSKFTNSGSGLGGCLSCVVFGIEFRIINYCDCTRSGRSLQQPSGVWPQRQLHSTGAWRNLASKYLYLNINRLYSTIRRFMIDIIYAIYDMRIKLILIFYI